MEHQKLELPLVNTMKGESKSLQGAWCGGCFVLYMKDAAQRNKVSMIVNIWNKQKKVN